MPTPPEIERHDTASNGPLAAALSELAGILGTLGIAADSGTFARRENPHEVIRTAATVLRGLTHQLSCAQVQRNLLATYAEDWFWRWDMSTGRIRIETPPSLRGPKKHHEAGSWHALCHPDDAGALKAIGGFAASGHDTLEVRLRMRDTADGWRDVQWKGRIVDRNRSGQGSLAAGTLRLPRAGTLAAKTSSQDEMRAKLDFLANISHEIRTPMTAILGASCLATETNDPAQQKALAQTIRSATESLVGLLDDALDFTKLEAGMVEPETVEFDLHALVGEVARIHGLEAMRKALDFIINVPPGTPVRVVSDPVRIRQIVTNLVSNAVKFTHRGEIELSVHSQPLAGDTTASALRISVRDTGIGIAAEKQDLIFDMFTQADGSTKRQFGGTGIGLSISRRLAALLGGTVRVDSAPGEGSVFQLDITVKTLPPAATSQSLPAAAGRRVLIVERNRTQRAALAKMVATLGAVADVVDDPDRQPSFDAAVRCGGACPDIVLADAAIPYVRAAAAAGQWPAGIDGRRVIVVRNPASVDWHCGCPEGALCLSLQKPVMLDDLAAVLVAGPLRDAGDADLLAAPALPETGCGDACSPRRILLVEDNGTSRDIIAAMLRRAGYEVDAVANGAEAVDAFQKDVFAYNIVLMDIQMPIMDGFEAAEEIRACEERRSWITSGNWHCTPILAMTADALRNIESRCLDAGMQGVLIKPSTPEVLLATIDRIIAEAEQASMRLELPGADTAQGGAGDSPGETAGEAAGETAGEAAIRLTSIRELGRRLDKALLDLDAPLRWAGNDPTILKQLIADFQAETPASSRQLDRLLADRQLADAAKLVHKMKSSLRILGAAETADHAERLQQACQAGDCERARNGWEELQASLQQLGRLLGDVAEII